jgi:steroid delta-isomerase-like uncharacterized protein
MANAESIAREMVDAINRDDMAAYKSLLHPEYSYRGPDGQVERGQDAGVAVIQMYRNAFPNDLKIEIQNIYAAGDTAVVEFIGGGTHGGELAGVAPTGRKVAVPVVTILEMRDGKVHTEREYFDSGYLMQQLGVTPAGATA